MDLRSILTQDSDPPPQAKPPLSVAPRYSPVNSSPHRHPPPHSYASPTATYNHAPIPSPQGYPPREPYSAINPNGRTSIPPYNKPSASPYPPLATGVANYNTPQGHPSQSPSAVSGHGHTQSPMSATSYSHPSQFSHGPTTPLGPPPPFSRTSSRMSREPPSPYSQQRTLSNNSHGISSTTPVSARGPGPVSESPVTYDNVSPQTERNGMDYTTLRERERTVSVSPKTVVPSRTQSIDLRRASREYDQAQVTPATSLQSILQPQTHSFVPQPSARGSDHSPQLRRESTPHALQQSSANTSRKVSPHPPRPISHSPSASRPPVVPQPDQQTKMAMHQAAPLQANTQPTSKPPVSQPTSRKRKRHDPVPIWAQKASASGRIAHTEPAVPQSNGHPQMPTETPTRPAGDNSEPNFADNRPYEEITRMLCDRLFQMLISVDAQLSPGEDLEIEAKLGKIMDQNTNERLRLPIQNEAILTDVRNIRFESDMPEVQFKTFNQYLNEQVKSSLHPSRVRIDYKHRKETDSFYELDQLGFNKVPALSRSRLHNNVKANKVRVTRDDYTGEVLAKIIKVRLSNVEMTFPNSQFDCRISINIEANYPGDIDDLVPAKEGGKPVSRKKDRLCYHHQACEIDLTQVHSLSDGRKTHEAEVELDTNILRHEFRLVQQDNGPNRFEDVTRAFMDNIRELVRMPFSGPEAG